MRDAARDVGPGRRPLRQNEFGDVVDGDDIAVLGFGRLFAGDAHRIISFLAVARHRDLTLDKALIAVARGQENLGEFGSDFGERQTEHFAFDPSDQPLRRAVEDGNPSVAVDTDDAGTGARQHRFGKPAPAVDEIAGAHDVFVLRAQLLRHVVERFA